MLLLNWFVSVPLAIYKQNVMSRPPHGYLLYIQYLKSIRAFIYKNPFCLSLIPQMGTRYFFRAVALIARTQTRSAKTLFRNSGIANSVKEKQRKFALSQWGTRREPVACLTTLHTWFDRYREAAGVDVQRGGRGDYFIWRSGRQAGKSGDNANSW